MYILIICMATIFAIWQILLHFGIFEVGVGASKLEDDIKIERKSNNKRKRERSKLSIYSQCSEYFRVFLLSEGTFEKHKYIIERLELRSDILDRTLTPEELRGKYILLLLVGLICIPLGVFFPLLLILSVLSVIVFVIYPKFYTTKIQDEDEIIDVYFIDLYLLMYSKLRMGSRARLQTVVESYIDTLQVTSNIEMKAVMLKFSKFLLNNLTMYEDHTAIPKLRYRYKSATIINFCNVASQALQGIDNADTLLTFKLDLVRRKTDLMKKNADTLLAKGERSIYLIYIILFIFIAVGWYSKLPTGFF